MTGWFKGPDAGQPHSFEDDGANLRDLADRFRSAYEHVEPGLTSPELLPVRLAGACAAALQVDGAGLSLFDDDLRLPLGASDDDASLAERLQFTQGEGPCLEGAAQQRVMVLDAAAIENRWPLFAAELFARTPFQGITTLPLSFDAKVKGAIDLFVRDPRRLWSLGLAGAAFVSTAVVEALAAGESDPPEAADGDEVFMPAWASGPAALRRRHVWIAVGMMMTQRDVPAPTALDLLRAYAYAHDSLLDDVASAVIEGRLDLRQLQD